MTTTTTRRAVLAGVPTAAAAVALPSVTSTAVAHTTAPTDATGLPTYHRRSYGEIAMRPASGSKDAAAALLGRVENIIGLLRGCHVADGWSVDDAECERALRYARNADWDDTGPEWQFFTDFLFEHGQSLDWVLMGDPGSMIAMLAGRSGRAKLIGVPLRPVS